MMFGVMIHDAEAKKVTYEINGKRYSYSTNNNAQTAQARRRIEAARIAEAAKAKAEAEKSKNPLAAAFGSPAQKEAAEAQSRLQQVLAENGPVIEESGAPPERRGDRRAKPAADAKPAQRTAALEQKPVSPAKTPVVAASPAVAMPALAPAVAEPLKVEHAVKRVKSISFDVESGIKTTVMVDGTMEEEPFDSSVLSQLAPDQGRATSLTAFVKQLRQASPDAPEEATGSIAAGTSPKPTTEASAQPVSGR